MPSPKKIKSPLNDIETLLLQNYMSFYTLSQILPFDIFIRHFSFISHNIAFLSDQDHFLPQWMKWAYHINNHTGDRMVYSLEFQGHCNAVYWNFKKRFIVICESGSGLPFVEDIFIFILQILKLFNLKEANNHIEYKVYFAINGDQTNNFFCVSYSYLFANKLLTNRQIDLDSPEDIIKLFKTINHTDICNKFFPFILQNFILEYDSENFNANYTEIKKLNKNRVTLTKKSAIFKNLETLKVTTPTIITTLKDVLDSNNSMCNLTRSPTNRKRLKTSLSKLNVGRILYTNKHDHHFFVKFHDIWHVVGSQLILFRNPYVKELRDQEDKEVIKIYEDSVNKVN